MNALLNAGLSFIQGNMETRRDERIGQLLAALKRSDKLHLKEAAALLGVSEMTIRRDLSANSAPVVLLGGYIVLEPRSASHYLLSDQKTRLVEEKRRASWLQACCSPIRWRFRLRHHHAVDHRSHSPRSAVYRRLLLLNTFRRYRKTAVPRNPLRR